MKTLEQSKGPISWQLRINLSCDLKKKRGNQNDKAENYTRVSVL